MKEMEKIRCVIMRGGTSKGIFLMGNDLPRDKEMCDKVILSIFGSPDVRQIDGLAGADPLTSKLAIISPSSRTDADVDYTFGQVSINSPKIDYKGNCGNISAAIGPFAIDEGLVRAGETMTKVRIYNTNTDKIIVADVPTVDGKAAVIGDCKVDGVPGTGAKIMLNYSNTVGAFTKKMLPTTNPIDILEVPGCGAIKVSIVDVANPMVFIKAEDIGLMGTETPQEIDGNSDLLNLLERIRGAAAVKIGMAKSIDSATSESPALPMIAFVNKPADYSDFTTGNLIKANAVDFVSRLMFMQITHKTYAGTASVCTACAAKIPGTVVYEVTNSPEEKKQIRIGHPAGVIEVESDAKYDDGQTEITRAAISRTARRIMDGNVYIRSSVFNRD